MPSDPKPYGDKPLVTKISLKKVQLERLRSENTPALSPMNKPINFNESRLPWTNSVDILTQGTSPPSLATIAEELHTGE